MSDDPSAAGVPATPAAEPARGSFPSVMVITGEDTAYDPWANCRDENGCVNIVFPPYPPPPPPPPRRTAGPIAARVEWERRQAERPRLEEERSKSLRDTLSPLALRFRAAAGTLEEALSSVFAAPFSADSTPHAEAVSQALDRVGDVIRAHDELPVVRRLAGCSRPRWLETGEFWPVDDPSEDWPAGIVERLERLDLPGVRDRMRYQAAVCAEVVLFAATDAAELRRAVGALLLPYPPKLAVGFLPHLVRLLEPDSDGRSPIWRRSDGGRGDDWVAGSPGDHYDPLGWLASGWRSDEMAALLRQREALTADVPSVDVAAEPPTGGEVQGDSPEQDLSGPGKTPSATPELPPIAPAAPPTAYSALSETKYAILDSLLAAGAVDHRNKITIAEVTRLVSGPKGKRGSFGRPVAQLVRCGLVASSGGRDGGVWLTPDGTTAAQRYRDSK